MEKMMQIIRLIKQKCVLGFKTIKESLSDVKTYRDVSLGLFVNGISGLNDYKPYFLVLTIVSILGIIVCNHAIRRKK